MSWKKLTSVAAICLLSASVANAQPKIDITQTGLAGGQRTFGVFVTPDPSRFSVDSSDPVNGTNFDSSSIAIEIGVTSRNPKGGAVPTYTGSQPVTANFQDDNVAPLGNPGNNPFQAGADTEGVTLQVNNTDLFAALGSTGDSTMPSVGLISERTLAFSFTVNNPVGVFNISGWDNVAGAVAGAIIAQDGTNFFQTGTFGIAGDFDTDGDVDINDFGVFAGRFNNPPDANNTGNFDLDNDVDINDFGVFAGNFNLTLPSSGSLQASAVPEPGTMLSAGLGLCLMLGIGARRRHPFV